MNDYQEYRSYGSYLGRVFAIILAFLLLVFAVWGVVRLASDDEEETLGDSGAPSFVVEDGDADGDQAQGQPDADLFVNGETTDDDEAADGDTATGDAATSDDDEGQTLSTNTDETTTDGSDDTSEGSAVAGTTTDENLPSTGAEILTVIPIGVATFVLSRAVLPKLQRQTD